METYLQEALFVLFLLCFIIQLYFLLTNQKGLKDYVLTDDLPAPGVPISVIISARNEAKNLSKNLPAILNQKYADYEVVVVNDCSYDGSDDLLSEMQERFPLLKVVTITEHDRFKTGKKFALTLGIKAAKNEHLLFTDADCVPASEHWVTRMASNFNDNTQIILGYSPYNRMRNFLNPLIRYETVKSAINYLSAALHGSAYMGVGRNLAYTKTLFFSAKGFAAHMHILSGDDDLFVNQNATSENTAIEIHPDAFVFTDAKTSFGGWFRQKRRHMGAGKLYKRKHKNWLTLDAVSGLMFYALFIVCLALRVEPLLILSVFLFRLVFQLIIYSTLFKRLNSKDMVWYLPILDVIYYIYLNTFGLVGAFLKTSQWK